MALRVLMPGLLSTVQDLGRRGYRRYGISPQGAVDPFSLRVANLLVGNPLGAAAVEITLGEAAFEAEEETVVALTGAAAEVRIDSCPVPEWEALPLPLGSRLEVGPCLSGARVYLALAGGVDVPPVMGSRSTDLVGGFGGLEGRALRSGDLLKAGKEGLAGEGKTAAGLAGRYFPPGLRPRCGGEARARVVAGPQADWFDGKDWEAFLSAAYIVTPRWDRMGFRLEGPSFRRVAGREMVSEGVVTGSVQVPPGGQPLVMLAGHQTLGGYPKPAVVASVDHGLIGQLRPGDSLCFQKVGLDEARLLLAAQEKILQEGVILQRRDIGKKGIGRSFLVKVGGRQYRVELEEL